MKPSAVASLSSSEETEPSEDKGTDGKLCFKIPNPKRTFHEALFSFVWKLPKSQLNTTEIGKCLDFHFTKGFVMKCVAPAVVLVGEMP